MCVRTRHVFCSPEELINFVHPLLAACKEEGIVISVREINILSQWGSFLGSAKENLCIIDPYTHTSTHTIASVRVPAFYVWAFTQRLYMRYFSCISPHAHLITEMPDAPRLEAPRVLHVLQLQPHVASLPVGQLAALQQRRLHVQLARDRLSVHDVRSHVDNGQSTELAIHRMHIACFVRDTPPAEYIL